MSDTSTMNTDNNDTLETSSRLRQTPKALPRSRDGAAARRRSSADLQGGTPHSRASKIPLFATTKTPSDLALKERTQGLARGDASPLTPASDQLSSTVVRRTPVPEAHQQAFGSPLVTGEQAPDATPMLNLLGSPAEEREPGPLPADTLPSSAAPASKRAPAAAAAKRSTIAVLSRKALQVSTLAEASALVGAVRRASMGVTRDQSSQIAPPSQAAAQRRASVGGVAAAQRAAAAAAEQPPKARATAAPAAGSTLFKPTAAYLAKGKDRVPTVKKTLKVPEGSTLAEASALIGAARRASMGVDPAPAAAAVSALPPTAPGGADPAAAGRLTAAARAARRQSQLHVPLASMHIPASAAAPQPEAPNNGLAEGAVRRQSQLQQPPSQAATAAAAAIRTCPIEQTSHLLKPTAAFNAKRRESVDSLLPMLRSGQQPAAPAAARRQSGVPPPARAFAPGRASLSGAPPRPPAATAAARATRAQLSRTQEASGTRPGQARRADVSMDAGVAEPLVAVPEAEAVVAGEVQQHDAVVLPPRAETPTGLAGEMQASHVTIRGSTCPITPGFSKQQRGSVEVLPQHVNVAERRRVFEGGDADSPAAAAAAAAQQQKLRSAPVTGYEIEQAEAAAAAAAAAAARLVVHSPYGGSISNPLAELATAYADVEELEAARDSPPRSPNGGAVVAAAAATTAACGDSDSDAGGSAENTFDAPIVYDPTLSSGNSSRLSERPEPARAPTFLNNPLYRRLGEKDDSAGGFPLSPTSEASPGDWGAPDMDAAHYLPLSPMRMFGVSEAAPEPQRVEAVAEDIEKLQPAAAAAAAAAQPLDDAAVSDSDSLNFDTIVPASLRRTLFKGEQEPEQTATTVIQAVAQETAAVPAVGQGTDGKDGDHARRLFDAGQAATVAQPLAATAPLAAAEVQPQPTPGEASGVSPAAPPNTPWEGDAAASTTADQAAAINAAVTKQAAAATTPRARRSVPAGGSRLKSASKPAAVETPGSAVRASRTGQLPPRTATASPAAAVATSTPAAQRQRVAPPRAAVPVTPAAAGVTPAAQPGKLPRTPVAGTTPARPAAATAAAVKLATPVPALTRTPALHRRASAIGTVQGAAPVLAPGAANRATAAAAAAVPHSAEAPVTELTATAEAKIAEGAEPAAEEQPVTMAPRPRLSMGGGAHGLLPPPQDDSAVPKNPVSATARAKLYAESLRAANKAHTGLARNRPDSKRLSLPGAMQPLEPVAELQPKAADAAAAVAAVRAPAAKKADRRLSRGPVAQTWGEARVLVPAREKAAAAAGRAAGVSGAQPLLQPTAGPRRTGAAKGLVATPAQAAATARMAAQLAALEVRTAAVLKEVVDGEQLSPAAPSESGSNDMRPARRRAAAAAAAAAALMAGLVDGSPAAVARTRPAEDDVDDEVPEAVARDDISDAESENTPVKFKPAAVARLKVPTASRASRYAPAASGSTGGSPPPLEVATPDGAATPGENEMPVDAAATPVAGTAAAVAVPAASPLEGTPLQQQFYTPQAAWEASAAIAPAATSEVEQYYTPVDTVSKLQPPTPEPDTVTAAATADAVLDAGTAAAPQLPAADVESVPPPAPFAFGASFAVVPGSGGDEHASPVVFVPSAAITPATVGSAADAADAAAGGEGLAKSLLSSFTFMSAGTPGSAGRRSGGRAAKPQASRSAKKLQRRSLSGSQMSGHSWRTTLASVGPAAQPREDNGEEEQAYDRDAGSAVSSKRTRGVVSEVDWDAGMTPAHEASAAEVTSLAEAPAVQDPHQLLTVSLQDVLMEVPSPATAADTAAALQPLEGAADAGTYAAASAALQPRQEQQQLEHVTLSASGLTSPHVNLASPLPNLASPYGNVGFSPLSNLASPAVNLASPSPDVFHRSRAATESPLVSFGVPIMSAADMSFVSPGGRLQQAAATDGGAVVTPASAGIEVDGGISESAIKREASAVAAAISGSSAAMDASLMTPGVEQVPAGRGGQRQLSPEPFAPLGGVFATLGAQEEPAEQEPTSGEAADVEADARSDVSDSGSFNISADLSSDLEDVATVDNDGATGGGYMATTWSSFNPLFAEAGSPSAAVAAGSSSGGGARQLQPLLQQLGLATIMEDPSRLSSVAAEDSARAAAAVAEAALLPYSASRAREETSQPLLPLETSVVESIDADVAAAASPAAVAERSAAEMALPDLATAAQQAVAALAQAVAGLQRTATAASEREATLAAQRTAPDEPGMQQAQKGH